MKFLFSIFFIFSIFPAYCQILNLEKDWFTHDAFFNEVEVKAKKIKSISILKQYKLDGKAFEIEEKVASYHFYNNGLTKQTTRFQNSKYGVDSTNFYFYYNSNETLFKRIEKEGPFHFIFYFTYNSGNLEKEVKIDGNSPNLDTAYLRLFENKIETQVTTTTHFNSIKKPFKTSLIERDLFNQTIRAETKFKRSSNFSKTLYIYELRQLNHKKKESYFGTKYSKLDYRYSYKKGFLDLIKVIKNEKTLFKYGLLYLPNGLIDAVVERNLNEKSITIYKFNYEFIN